MKILKILRIIIIFVLFLLWFIPLKWFIEFLAVGPEEANKSIEVLIDKLLRQYE